MKSLIDFSEEVATPSSSPPKQQMSCQAYFETIGYIRNDDDDETNQTTSSTSTDSESDGVSSDYDENDISYHDSSVQCDDDTPATEDTVTTVSDDETASSAKQRRSVSFGPIHVRQYERIVGDHPDTKVGVPLSIGWAYYEDDDHPEGIPIDRYECDRIRRGKVRMSSITRKNILLNVHGLPEEEILLAEKRSKKLRKEREKSKGIYQTPLKKLGKKIRKGGMSVLKQMSYASQMGSAASLVAAGHNF